MKCTAILSVVVSIVISCFVVTIGAAAADCVDSPDGTACDDGSTCTVGESCHSGACIASVRFAQAGNSPIMIGYYPRPVTADLNLDNVPDLAVLNYGENTATVLLGDGTGQFIQPDGSPMQIEPGAQSIAIGDFNVDGKPDLAFVRASPGQVVVYLGDGAGHFRRSPEPPVLAGGNTVAIAVADFNLDGKPDVVTTDLNVRTLRVLLGDGAGGFAEAPGSPVPAGSGPGLSLGDFNLDGKPDVAVGDQVSGGVIILLGDGSGRFIPAPGSPVPVGFGPYSVAGGDLNLDGKLDLVVAGQINVTILLGDGSGRFSAREAWVPPGQAFLSHVSVGDFNVDGKPDIAVLNFSSGDLTLLLGDAMDGFVPVADSTFVIGEFPVDAVIGDFDRNDNPDLAVARSVSNPADGALKILLGIPEVAPAGTTCSDGNACTTNDLCTSAKCLGGPQVECDDGNGCTDDFCDPDSGCYATNNTGPCDDGNACTLADLCSAGRCTGQNPVACTAADQCHAAGVCDPRTGICSNPNKPEGTLCSDGDICTLGDRCLSGVCRGQDSDGDGVGDLCDSCPLDPWNDADQDRVCGDVDECANSSLGSTVSVSGCGSGVVNTLFVTGCTLQDVINDCQTRSKNHGEFVSCVSHLTDDLRSQGVLTERDKSLLQSCAAKSNPDPA